MLRRCVVSLLLFLPLLLNTASADARVAVVKGLAQLDWSHNEDRAALGVSAWYAWGMNSCGVDYAHCTPMNRNWDTAAQIFCPPTELVGNEPTNPEPAGHPISPHDAVTSTLAIAAMCPNTQLIVANIHVNNGNGQADLAWLTSYYSEYKLLSGHEYGLLPHTSGLFDLVGLHCYAVYNSICRDRLNAALALTGYHGHAWLTEWGVFGDQYHYGNGHEFADALAYIAGQLRIDRSYIWTNRGSGTLLDLVTASGVLTTQGVQYRDWNTSSTVWKTQLPLVKGASQGYP